MTNYQRGAYRERLARKELEARGYTVVRSAGSKGAADLVAICKNHVLLVQVKSEGEVRSDDLDRLRAIPAPRSIRCEVWERLRGRWKIYSC